MVYQHHHSSHSNPQKNLATLPDLREAAETFSFCGLGQGSAMAGLRSAPEGLCEGMGGGKEPTLGTGWLPRGLNCWGFNLGSGLTLGSLRLHGGCFRLTDSCKTPSAAASMCMMLCTQVCYCDQFLQVFLSCATPTRIGLSWGTRIWLHS